MPEIIKPPARVHAPFLLKPMEVCTTGGRLSQTTDDVVEIVLSRKGSFLPTPECDMVAVGALALRCQIHRSRPPGLPIGPVWTV
ncbi:MAG: hypothetical protein WCF40_00775 [Desulfobacterales bacterium]